MHIKVRGGTVQHGQPSLCATCKYATVVRGRSLQEEIVECAQLSSGHGRIRFPVTQCNEYLDRNHPTVRDMESIAWVLRTDSSRKHIGFVRSRDLKPGDRFVLPEIGVRMALGARPGDVLRLVLGQAGRLSLVGLGAGAVLAAVVGRVLGSLVYGVSVLDPVAYAVAATILLAVAAVASLAPALAAARVDPLRALRSE